MERAVDIYELRRLGTLKLEDIGKKWGITRERVRQIDEYMRKQVFFEQGNEKDPARECHYCKRIFYDRRINRVFCSSVCSRIGSKHKQYLRSQTPEGKERARLLREKAKVFRQSQKQQYYKVCAQAGCGKEFLTGTKRKLYCGSNTLKTGCSYLRQVSFCYAHYGGMFCRDCKKQMPLRSRKDKVKAPGKKFTKMGSYRCADCFKAWERRKRQATVLPALEEIKAIVEARNKK